MKKTITTLFIATVLLTSCNSESSRPKTPEELKAELKLQEQSSPTLYLQADATMKPNRVQTREAGLFHDAEYKDDGYNIDGTIKNSATVAKFKDVIITLTFYSKTETAIEEKDYPFYEFYEPNSTKAFSIHAYPPEETKTFHVEVKSATAVN